MKLVTARTSMTPHGPGIGASQASRGVPLLPVGVLPRGFSRRPMAELTLDQALAAGVVAKRCRTAHRVALGRRGSLVRYSRF